MNSYIKSIKFGKYILYYININEIRNCFLKLIKIYCNINDIKKIKKFIKLDDKLRALGSIILQKFICKKYFNINSPNYKININRLDKPYIVHQNKKINYNISHDEELVLIAYHLNKSIGVDVLSTNKKINFKINNFLNYSKQQSFTIIESILKLNGRNKIIRKNMRISTGIITISHQKLKSKFFISVVNN